MCVGSIKSHESTDLCYDPSEMHRKIGTMDAIPKFETPSCVIFDKVGKIHHKRAPFRELQRRQAGWIFWIVCSPPRANG